MKQDLVLLIISGQSKHHQSRESIWKKKTESCLGPFGNSCQEILVEQVPVKYVMTSSSGEFSAQFSVVESVVSLLGGTVAVALLAAAREKAPIFLARTLL